MPKAFSKALSPGSTIGILGGGQLGRMLAMAAARLGYRTVVLDPAEDCPAGQTSNRQIVADYDDVDALEHLSKTCHVVTYEFENIPANAVSFLEENTVLYPSSDVLAKSQDRLLEKQFLASLEVPVAPYFAINSLSDLERSVIQLATDSVLKTRRFGYDGKGQVRLPAAADNGAVSNAWEDVQNAPCILEGFVNFQCEISLIISRDIHGEVAIYDPAENLHHAGILRSSSVPARISDQTGIEARTIAEKIVTALDYVGVMGVEFFIDPDGRAVVNEIAPRVHNSGHWTEAACIVSQFEQHVRAITGCPLADPARHSDCVMENLVGDDMDRLPDLLANRDILLHLYGKEETRPGRKMGHFTRLKR